MKIAKDKVVSVTYELSILNNDTEIIEKVTDQRPLTFLLGHNNLLPKFELALTGLQTGESFDFILNSNEAYGQIIQEAVIELPKSVFKNDDQIDESLFFIGNVVPMMDKDGNHFNGKIIELYDDKVKMDFNHPLAGEDLHFKGQVIEVREALEEEIAHGHIHNPQNCNGCESDCGNGCK
jgi:FKBP-type peptidyl-prolyl cis-trans isomerase SlyD